MFRIFGGLGLLAAVVVGWSVGRSVGFTPVSLWVLAIGSLVSFSASVLGQAAARGMVNLIALREAGIVMAAVILCCLIAHVAVPAGLDVAATAIAAALALGRIGCLSAACCYGRPARHGIRYTSVHAEIGLPWYLVGVRLVPVQLWEACVLALLVPVGSVIAHTQPAGTAFGFLVVAYAALRAVLDPLRGDPRTRRGGLSAVQWLAAVMGITVAGTSTAGLLQPWLLWLGAAPAIIVAATQLTASGLLAPEHVAELATAQDGPVVTTRRGIRIAYAHTGPVEHYAVSSTPPLGTTEIRKLARVLRDLHHPGQTIEVVHGRADTTHLIVKQDPPGNSSGLDRASVW